MTEYKVKKKYPKNTKLILVNFLIKNPKRKFNNTDEWWLSIPEEIRPKKDQPFYHLLAENDVTEYVAYVSEQNLLYDINKDPVRHPQVNELFSEYKDGSYLMSQERMH